METKPVQKEVFLKGEGDQYFRRNSVPAQERPEFSFYARYFEPGARVLEIGCSDGRNLELFHRLKKIEGHGIDPSGEAVEKGRKTCPHLQLSVGTADKLDFADESFDFVLFGFCFYLIDRKHLLKAASEADRVLKDRGHLGITDFDPDKPYKRPYKHDPRVTTHKMDYSKLFLSSPHYSLVEKYLYSDAGPGLAADVQQRLSSVVLRKDAAGGYAG